GENARALTSNNAIEESNVELSPDNSQMLFVADANERMELYYQRALFIVPATWSPDGRSIIANVNMGVHSELVLIDPATRSVRQLTDGEHFIPPSWAVVPS